MLNMRKTNTLEFAINECSSSEHSTGESSSTIRNFSNVIDSAKTLRINDRSSPIPQRHQQQQHNQIYKSKSGQSIKDFQKRQET